MNRASLAGFILMGAGALAWFAWAGDDHGLCVNGHPAPRKPGITYGGKPIIPGYVRDHKWPLCLGGPDVASNVQYQTIEEGRASDKVEWSACEAYCKGEISLETARKMVADQKGRK